MKEIVTLMYFRTRGGKARTLKVPKKTLNAVLFVSLIILFLSGFSTYMMVSFFTKNYRLLDELEAIKEEKRVLEMKLSAIEKHPSVENMEQGKTEVEKDETVMEVEGEEDKEEAAENKVRLENIRITETEAGEGFTLYFDVVKENIDEDKLSGLVIIIAKAGDKYFTVPKSVEVKEGLPAQYMRGERFVIKYRKPFEKTISLPIDSIEGLDIFVYGEKGALLLRQTVEVK